jgi:hypothetical protein
VTSVADDEGLITDEDQNQVENAAKLFENRSKCTRSRAPISESKHQKNVPKLLKKSTCTVSLSTSTNEAFNCGNVKVGGEGMCQVSGLQPLRKATPAIALLIADRPMVSRSSKPLRTQVAF